MRISDWSSDVCSSDLEVKRNGALVESYTFDANSNRARKTTPRGTITYSYDAQDRLLEARGTNGVTSYTYTDAGELRSKSTAAGTTAYDYRTEAGREGETCVRTCSIRGSPVHKKKKR